MNDPAPNVPPEPMVRELDRNPEWILEEHTQSGSGEVTLVLCVLVGWIGAYEVSHALTADQMMAWRREGRDYLTQLSGDINAREIAGCRQRMAMNNR